MIENCPLRHENGNCLPHGGFCTSISENVCNAILQAYEAGKNAFANNEMTLLGYNIDDLIFVFNLYKQKGIILDDVVKSFRNGYEAASDEFHDAIKKIIRGENETHIDIPLQIDIPPIEVPPPKIEFDPRFYDMPVFPKKIAAIKLNKKEGEKNESE